MVSEPAIVLISCAKDTLAGLGGDLFKSLKDRGYPTKVASDDHQELNREEIVRFKIFIIVLSNHYVTCPSRLDKLVEILHEFRGSKPRRVIPFFFDVEPFDVKNARGSFEIAFEIYKNFVDPEKLKKWKEALTEAGRIAGKHFKRSGDKYLHDYIEEITQEVSETVPCSVGLYRRVEAVNDHLKTDDGVQRVLIHGEAGIGKTTLAHEVYHSNGVNKFFFHHFFNKVGEYLENGGCLIRKLLDEMIGDKDIKFRDFQEGKSILEQKVKQLKSFLVLEDILDQKQLEYIVDVTNCFGSNSEVIITAVDHFLECPQVKRCEVERFRAKDEALLLLSLKTFNSMKIEVTYLDVFQQAVTIACGVPLTLEVIGSYFRGKSVEKCMSILGQYKNIQNGKKQGILQMSFDDLEGNQKEMLIDIAGVLDREELTMVELCRVHAKDDIKVLLDTSLMKINEHGLVTMHNLTQNMVKSRAQSL